MFKRSLFCTPTQHQNHSDKPIQEVGDGDIVPKQGDVDVAIMTTEECNSIPLDSDRLTDTQISNR